MDYLYTTLLLLFWLNCMYTCIYSMLFYVYCFTNRSVTCSLGHQHRVAGCGVPLCFLFSFLPVGLFCCLIKHFTCVWTQTSVLWWFLSPPRDKYWVLPFGLALSPRTFTKCLDATLAPLRLQGIHVLNYNDDWLILTHSEQMWFEHMKVLRLRLNTKKSVLSPLQRTIYLGVVWDPTAMQACLSPAHIESIQSREWKKASSLTLKQFQRLLGLMAAVSNVIPFGLLYMRPLQWWLKTKGFYLRGNPLWNFKVT